MLKVLYISCNPLDHDPLLVDGEITELQLRFIAAIGEPVQFLVCPRLPVEQLGLEIAAHRPDILHISSHAKDGRLVLANSDGAAVEVKASMLATFLDIERPPRLVYLNSCNSVEIARQLVAMIPMAVGTTAPITNRSAMASALLFYDRLLSGSSVQKAYEAGRATIEALQSESASSTLFKRRGIEPARERFHEVPRIIARFDGDGFKPDGRGVFEVHRGVMGCPSDTSQLVLFTDDMTFVFEAEEDDESGLAGELCTVTRSTAVRGVLWSETTVETYGDHRIFAAGVTAGGRVFSVSAMLSDALEAYYTKVNLLPGRPAISAAIDRLLREDGAELEIASRLKKNGKKTAKLTARARSRAAKAKD